MKDILLVGGMGSGKSALANALQKTDASIHYLYGGQYATYVPMALMNSTHPHLLSLPKAEYIGAVVEHYTMPFTRPPREETDAFGRAIMEKYGDTIIAEVGLALVDPTKRNVADNTPRLANVAHFREHGFYVVLLKCDFDTQVHRRLTDGSKGIDPTDRESLIEQVRRTNAYFQVHEMSPLAHIIYDTDAIPEDDYADVAQEILAATR